MNEKKLDDGNDMCHNCHFFEGTHHRNPHCYVLDPDVVHETEQVLRNLRFGDVAERCKNRNEYLPPFFFALQN